MRVSHVCIHLLRYVSDLQVFIAFFEHEINARACIADITIEHGTHYWMIRYFDLVCKFIIIPVVSNAS